MELAFRAADDIHADILIFRGYTEGTWEVSDESGTSAERFEQFGRDVLYAAEVIDDQWSAQWRIPLRNLDITPGDRIRFNLTVRRTEGGRWIMWRPTHNHSYDVEEVGSLEFAL